VSPAEARVRKVLNEAVLHTLRVHGFGGKVVTLGEGDEIEVPAAPRFPVPGARFFLRVEIAAAAPKPKNGRGAKAKAPEHPQASVPTALMLAWRGVPEPVAVVGLDPATGEGRLGDVHSFLGWLDRTHRDWHRSPSVMVPLRHSLDGNSLPRLARAAADGHVLYKRILLSMIRGDREAAPTDVRGAVARLQALDFDYTVSCLDLLREAGLLEETHQRELRPTEACSDAFAKAVLQHAVSERGHADPATAEVAGRSAVVRVLQSRLPNVAESTLVRCGVVLCRFLPVDDVDAVVDLARDPAAMRKALEG
jgi:hypothetical protein